MTEFLGSNEGKAKFKRDRSLYSVAAGGSKPMVKCRERLAAVPGVSELLMQLTSFDPAKRPTMRECLRSPIFDAMAVQSQPEDEGVDWTWTYFSTEGQFDKDV